MAMAKGNRLSSTIVATSVDLGYSPDKVNGNNIKTVPPSTIASIKKNICVACISS